MKYYSSLKISLISKIACVFLMVFPFTASYATAGCCSHHHGVKGCNTATNHELCNDGTTSPTCLCGGGTTANTAQPKHKKQTGTSTSTSSTSNTMNENTTPTTTNEQPSTTAAPVSKSKTKGCCARHGGVAQCNTATGFMKCKDGTDSATCKC